jgi:hypothetical protein
MIYVLKILRKTIFSLSAAEVGVGLPLKPQTKIPSASAWARRP